MVKPPKLHDILKSEGFEARCVDYKNLMEFLDSLPDPKDSITYARGFAILPVRDGKETVYFIYTKPKA